MSKSDEELMREFQQGQEVAFVALYERYKMAIYGFVYRKLGHQGRAEDLTQEIFLALIEHRQEWRQESSFKTYLYRIAFNRSISELRRREYQITLSADDEAQAQRAANVPSRELSPAAQLEQQQMQYYLRQALTQLDSEYRDPIILREYEELSYEEIAEVLQLPLGTVKSRIFRGKVELKRLLTAAMQPAITLGNIAKSAEEKV